MSREQSIEQLNQDLSALRQQDEKLAVEAEKLEDRRDRLNERYKMLRQKISELREKRDRANDTVKELKSQRDRLRTTIHEKILLLKKARLKTKTVLQNRPRESAVMLEKELSELEWKIQTTSLTTQEEKALIEQVKEVESKLNVYRKSVQLNQQIVELQAGVRALELEGNLCHERLTQIAQNSQKTHQELLATIEESKKIKAEADETHQEFMIKIQEATQKHKEANEVLAKIRTLRGEIREEQLQTKKESEERLRGELEKKVREKLKRGEKLSWEEFQLLAESGIETHD